MQNRRKQARRVLAAALVAAATAAAAEKEAKSPWNADVSLGLNATRGNSETTVFKASAKAKRKSELTEWRFGAEETYGTTDGETTTENGNAFIAYKERWTKRWAGVLRLEALYDAEADLDYRVVASPGVSYEFLKETNTQFSVEAGPSYIWEKKGGITDQYPAARLAERFEHNVNDHVKVWHEVEYLPDLRGGGSFLLNAEIGLESALTSRLGFKCVVQDKFNSKPAETKEKNDFSFTTALSYKL